MNTTTAPRDAIPFQYQCSAGHLLGASRQQAKCPAYVQGQPCTGHLVRVGAGSRGPRGTR